MEYHKHKTALMYACEKGHLDTVKYLLEIINVNYQHENQKTALMYAVLGEQKKVIEYLINPKSALEIDHKLRDQYDYTALMLACKNKDKTILDCFLKVLKEKRLAVNLNVGARDKLGYTVLMWASKYNYIEIVDAFIERRSWYEKINMPQYENENFEARMKRDSKLDGEGLDGMTALKLASQEGHIEIVKRLIEVGVRE